MKTQNLIVIAAIACLLVGASGVTMARAEAQEPQLKYTGCISLSSGFIVRLAAGDNPSAACGLGLTEITFPGFDQIDVLQDQIDALTGLLDTTMIVECPSNMLQDAIDAAPPNTTILVEGECKENIHIPQSKQNLIIDGQFLEKDNASIIGDDSSAVVTILGRGITIRDFNSIVDGARGVVVANTASATIRNNVIVGAKGAGITVEANSFATIIGNTVRDHDGNGIAITEESAARIGSNCKLETFNAIMDNGASGIALSRNAEASIIGNLIQGNGTNGIFVTDGSMADTASNTIVANGGDGVDVRRGSSLRMGRRDTPEPGCAENPNKTFENALNTGYGIDCQSLSTVDGVLGSLNGALGSENLRNDNTDCPDCCFSSLALPLPLPQ